MLITSFHQTVWFNPFSLCAKRLSLLQIHNYARLFSTKTVISFRKRGMWYAREQPGERDEKSIEGWLVTQVAFYVQGQSELKLRMFRKSSFAYIKPGRFLESVACGTSRIIRSAIDVCKWQWCLLIIRFPLVAFSFLCLGLRLSNRTKSEWSEGLPLSVHSAWYQTSMLH